MNIRHLAAGFAAATMISGAVNAATISETFTFTGAANGNYSSIDVMGSQGNTVTITAGNFDNYPSGVESGANDYVARGNTWGLGAYTDGDFSQRWFKNHRVNGNGNEALIFDFDFLVSAIGATFGSFYGKFDIYGSTSGNNLNNDLASSVDLSSENVNGNRFIIGSYYNTHQFKLESLTVSYETPSAVPLPAAGWMLFAGLGGLAAMKRRRKTA